LSVSLDKIFTDAQESAAGYAQVEKALLLAQYYVSSAQRSFVALITGHHNSYMSEIHQWWSQMDEVHGALQKLLRLIQNPPPDASISHHQAESDLLLCARLDVRILDLFNLAHAFLGQQELLLVGTTEGPSLTNLLAMSELRVRKCLKLTSFYAKTFSDSFDKHVLYHLFTQLEVLPWVQLVVQRCGSPLGPETPEYEISETELGWFTRALEIACFYSPVAAHRLYEMQAARHAERLRRLFASTPFPFLTPSSSYSSSSSSVNQCAVSNSMRSRSPSPSRSAWDNDTSPSFQEELDETCRTDTAFAGDVDFTVFLPVLTDDEGGHPLASAVSQDTPPFPTFEERGLWENPASW